MYINKRSIGYFFAIFTCLIIVLLIPGIVSLQSATQKQATMEHNNALSQTATITSIFNNNLVIAGISFIPYAGWGWLIFVLWNTGTVAASYSQPWYWLLLNPFTYIEIAVYSYMVLKSIWIVQLFKRRKTKFTDLEGNLVVRKTTGVWPEIAKTAAYAFITCTVTLLVSAFIEFAIIHA